LKVYIETSVRISGKKSVLVSHSMGSQVLFYFFHWVEAGGYGGGSPGWVEKYIDSWINISGCMLGAPKGLPAVLSGEMKDTAQLNSFAVYGLEKFLSREERTDIFRAMPGISSMLPKGGDAVWGNNTWAPDDRFGQEASYGSFINFRESNSTRSGKNLTMSESVEYLLERSDPWYKAAVSANYSHGIAHTRKEVEVRPAPPNPRFLLMFERKTSEIHESGPTLSRPDYRAHPASRSIASTVCHLREALCGPLI
jgi:phospholipid:diacylglycerol acyltransferase